MAILSNDKVSYVFEETIFEPFRTQIDVPIPEINREFIVDARLRIQTRLDSAPKHVSTISPEGAHDVRLYFDSTDVTAYYLKALAEALDQLDQNELAQRYAAAMDTFIAYADSQGQAYDGLISSLKAAAGKLASTRPISSLLKMVGDENQGHKGHLHLHNFLHSSIVAPEVSAVRILQLFDLDHPKMLDGFRLKSLTFSCGASMTRDPAGWKKEKPRPRGGIAVTIAVQMHDPLEDEVAKLRDELKRLEEAITDSLERIKDALDVNGPIRRTVSRIETVTDKTTLDVEAARRDIKSCEAQVQGQAGTLTQIKTVVDAL